MESSKKLEALGCNSYKVRMQSVHNSYISYTNRVRIVYGHPKTFPIGDRNGGPTSTVWDQYGNLYSGDWYYSEVSKCLTLFIGIGIEFLSIKTH
jgi:hypothetical protein